jgi:hypothetical protein
MKKFKFGDLIGMALIAAGIIIFGIITFQELLLSDSAGTNLPGSRKISTVKRAPTPAIEPAISKKIREYLQSQNSQLVNGFATIKTFSHKDTYDFWGGRVQSWWEYSQYPEEEVVWYSQTCPEKQDTTLVFSGIMGVAQGEARLYLNNIPILLFNTGSGPESEEWEGEECRFKFLALRIKKNQERLGIFCLTMPKEMVVPGKPILLKVTGYQKKESGNSFFMLNKWPDTLRSLKLPSR